MERIELRKTKIINDQIVSVPVSIEEIAEKVNEIVEWINENAHLLETGAVGLQDN